MFPQLSDIEDKVYYRILFCTTHVHPYPLMSPSSVTLDGTSIDDLLIKMQEAHNKVLNGNIRIN